MKTYEFMEIVDVTDRLWPAHKDYIKVYIQFDVNDWHIFRIIEWDYDNNPWVYTVEMENIEKKYKELGLDDEIIEHILENDTFENWDYSVVDSLDEAISLIKES